MSRAYPAFAMPLLLCACVQPRPVSLPTPTANPADSRPLPGRDVTVKDWTRKQRGCEVGDRHDQRRCVMDYPGDQPDPYRKY
mgnify:CR=1 FL=1